MESTSIRISKSTHSELMKISGYLQAKTGKFASIEDAIIELLGNYKKKG
jgi:hypothetical protein